MKQTTLLLLFISLLVNGQSDSKERILACSHKEVTNSKSNFLPLASAISIYDRPLLALPQQQISDPEWKTIYDLGINSCEKEIITHLSNLSWLNQKYFEKDKLSDHKGYVAGMCLIYYRLYSMHTNGNNIANKISIVPKASNRENDALLLHANKFTSLGINDADQGIPALRKVFTLLFGLGMYESDGDYTCGLHIDQDELEAAGNDRAEAKARKKASEAEAGMFQTSHTVGVEKSPPYSNDTSLVGFKDIVDLYKTFLNLMDESGMEEVFKIGRLKRPNPQPHLARNENTSAKGYQFQKLVYENPYFSTLLVGLGMRFRLKHWGPLKNNTIKIKKECYDLLLKIEEIVNANNCISETGLVRVKNTTEYNLLDNSRIIDIACDNGIINYVVMKADSSTSMYTYNRQTRRLSNEMMDVKRVTVDYEGNEWIIDSHGNVFRWIDLEFKSFGSELVNDVFFGKDGSKWMLAKEMISNLGHRIYKYDNTSAKWMLYDDQGLVTKIAFNTNGELIGINKIGDLWIRKSAGWSRINLDYKMGPVIDLAINDKNEIWVVCQNSGNSSNGSIYRYINNTHWLQYDGSANLIEFIPGEKLPLLVKDQKEILNMSNTY